MGKVQARDVSFGYNGSNVLHDISLTVKTGCILSLLGPNGSGKTTLLKVLLGLYPPNSGQVFLEDSPIAQFTPRQLARKIAYVPQTHKMSFAYSVFDVILMGRAPYSSLFSRYRKKDRDIAMQTMERLSIGKLKDRIYTEVSGGERQLALIGRALAQGADTLVMDEPLTGLDYGNQIRVLECIKGLALEGYTFIETTHFPDHALWVSDRAVLMRHGKILADGPTQSVITEKAISDLYEKDIAIIDVRNGVRTCMPRSILKDGARAHRSYGLQEDGGASCGYPLLTGFILPGGCPGRPASCCPCWCICASFASLLNNAGLRPCRAGSAWPWFRAGTPREKPTRKGARQGQRRILPT